MLHHMNSNNNWSRLEDKLFEQALVMFPEGTSHRWQKIAERIPGKSSIEVQERYDMLLYDVNEIEAGRVQIPNYPDDSDMLSASSNSDNQIRKKGTPWSEEEHKRFLIGLKLLGKGDWRSISRHVVVTRTPTQVASHAQKYFLRQSALNKGRKRSSIHDINTVDSGTLDAFAKQNCSMADSSVEKELSPDLGSHLPPQGQGRYQNYGVSMADGSVEQQLPPSHGSHLPPQRQAGYGVSMADGGVGSHLPPQGQAGCQNYGNFMADGGVAKQLPLGPGSHLPPQGQAGYQNYGVSMTDGGVNF